MELLNKIIHLLKIISKKLQFIEIPFQKIFQGDAGKFEKRMALNNKYKILIKLASIWI